MAIDLVVDADLEFSVDLGSRTVTGTLTGSGRQLELRVSDPFLFAGRSDAGVVRALADGLAQRSLAVTVVAPSGPLVTLGAPRTSWLQRRLSGSRHIRIERGAGLWSLLRGRTQAPRGGALPTSDLQPPGTLFPIVPTLRRQPRQPVTTTHDPGGGGNPRLIMAPHADHRLGDRRAVYPLRDDVTTVGGSEECDITLAGLDPLHAKILHDDDDEFVLVRSIGSSAPRVNGEPVDAARLRTSCRIELGGWTMSFYREEFADHGRPYGGRIGGELGHQRPQPSRPARHRSDQADM